MREISDRIREMREISGFTREQMAAELGVSLPVYSEYETKGENIPISAIYHIANLFKVDMFQLLTGMTPRIDTFCVMPSGRGEKIDRYPGYYFQGLASRYRDKIMEPMIVTVEPSDADPGLVTHPGQELNYVLEGSVLVLFDDKRILLEKGDSIYFNPAHPHGQRAMNSRTAKFLTVIAE